MFEVDVNGLTQQYRTKPTMNVDITGSSGSIPKPLTYDYMPEGYPSKSEETTSIEVDITWDGNTTGLIASSMNHWYRVSDAVYTLEQFKKMNYVVSNNDTSCSSVIEEGGLNSSAGLFTLWDGTSAPVIVAAEAVTERSTIMGSAPDTFTEPGVYFPADGNVTRLYSTEPLVEVKTTVKKLNEEFLPYKAMKENNPVAFGKFEMNADASYNGDYSFCEGYRNSATGTAAHAEGKYTEAAGDNSHTEGLGTRANSENQHAQGKYNIFDSDGVYAHIVGNGTDLSNRSNAHTLDWSGNAWFAGAVEGTAMIVKSSTAGSSKRFKITVDDSGTISATEVT